MDENKDIQSVTDIPDAIPAEQIGTVITMPEPTVVVATEQPAHVAVETAAPIPTTVREVPVELGKQNISAQITLQNGTAEEVEQILKNKINDPNEYNVAVRQDPYVKKLTQALTDITKQNELCMSMITELFAAGKTLKPNPDPIADKLNHGPTLAIAANGVKPKLKGKQAELTILAKRKGLRKVHLFNSGFWITLRPIDLDEMNSFYSTVDASGEEYGHILGGHFYMITDLFLKLQFMSILHELVVDSNLKHWDRGETLQRNISLHDFDPIIWAVCSLIYKEGVELGMVCVNPDCSFVDDQFKIDLTKIRFNNFDIMPPAAIDFVMKGAVVTEPELEEYRNKILGFHKSIVVGEATYHLQVPTMDDYLKQGKSLIGKISAALKGDMTWSNTKTQQQILINLYRMLGPWIGQIEYADFTVDEADVISTNLGADQQEGGNLFEQVEEFMKETKITHICYTGLECPMCHKKPSSSVNDYMSVDVQQLFFALCYRQLELIGQ